jgi:hypothetical protein
MNQRALQHHLAPIAGGCDLPYYYCSPRSRRGTTSLQSTLEIIDAALAVVEGCPYTNSAVGACCHRPREGVRRTRSSSTSSSNCTEESETMEPKQ